MSEFEIRYRILDTNNEILKVDRYNFGGSGRVSYIYTDTFENLTTEDLKRIYVSPGFRVEQYLEKIK